MKKHVELLGILYIAYHALGIFAGIIVFTVLTGTGLFTGIVSGIGDPFAGKMVMSIIPGIGLIIAILLCLLSIPGIIGGYGLLKGFPWSRILVLILGCFNLLQIPFGLMLGIYTFWVLMQDETVELFSSKQSVD